jgi:hypothetical protein
MTLAGNGDAVCSPTHAFEARVSGGHGGRATSGGGLAHEGGLHRVTLADCKVLCTMRRDHFLLS